METKTTKNAHQTILEDIPTALLSIVNSSLYSTLYNVTIVNAVLCSKIQQLQLDYSVVM